MSTARFTPMQNPAVFASFMPILFLPRPPVTPVRRFLQADEEFPVSRRSRERGIAAPQDRKTEAPAERFDLREDPLVERRVANDAVVPDLVLSHLELRFDQGDEERAVLDQLQNGRNDQLQRDEGGVDHGKVDPVGDARPVVSGGCSSVRC